MGTPRRQSKRPAVAESPKTPLGPHNRRLLAFLEKLAAKPDDLGDAWWDEFRESLRKNPVRLGKTPGD
jgi:hypothetical protein